MTSLVILRAKACFHDRKVMSSKQLEMLVESNGIDRSHCLESIWNCSCNGAKHEENEAQKGPEMGSKGPMDSLRRRLADKL